MSTRRVVGFEVESHVQHGGPDGFLRVERYRLTNRRADGTHSKRYVCDFLGRPKGPDAVVVALYHRGTDNRVMVLLRDGLRPALTLGRPDAELPVPESRTSLTFTEVVAGIIEREDQGRAGVQYRAAVEAYEEAGYRVAASDVEFLGAGTFPSPGSMPEKFWLTAAHVEDVERRDEPPTDGSPMEEGATVRWMELDAAIAACVRGEIEDCKTELVLRRLRERLARPLPPRG
ncbi:MAG: NUDIX hydrolase [Myxococcota bacterium]